MSFVEIAIGLVLALAVGWSATAGRFDRDRSFYPVVLMVIASYYPLFALMGGVAWQTFAVELAVVIAFSVAAIAGYRHSQWILVAGLAAHGVFDVFHGIFISNPGVPRWWPGFCLGYDLPAAAWLAWILRVRSRAGLL